jgi:hypothetical protein
VVLSPVHQHVNERVTHRPGRGHGARVVAITPNWTSPAEYAVHGARHTNGQAAKSASQRRPVVCLHEQMDMIVLDAEV